MAIEKTKLYNGEIELLFDKDKHLYTVNGKPVYGVTSIVGIINKPALINWAINATTDYIIANKERLGEEFASVIKESKSASHNISVEARELGTRVHSFADRWFPDNKFELVQELLKIDDEKERKAISAFIEFLKNNKIERQFGERKIYSKKYKYAGTVDFVGKINNELVVADYKTSSAIYPEYFLQTAAYAQALEEELKIKIKKTMIVRVSKTGRLEVKENQNWKKDVPVFLASLDVYKWQMSLVDEEFNS